MRIGDERMKINALIKVQFNCENCEKTRRNQIEKKLKMELRKRVLDDVKRFIKDYNITDCELKEEENHENKEKT